MDPVTGAMLVGASAQVIAGIVGELIARGDRDKAFELLKQAAAEGNVPLPDLQKIAAEQLGPSAFEEITADPRLKEYQMSALDRLTQIDDAGGMMLVDEANLNRAMGKATRVANAGNAAVKEDMAARGVGGSGAELAMQLSNNQASAQRASESGMDVAAMAQQRALDAIMARGNMAGAVRGQDFDEQARTAEAKDLISRYNAGARERATQHNAGLPQQHFENTIARNRMRAQGKRDMAGYYQDEAARKAGMAVKTGEGVAKGAYAYGDYKTDRK